MGGDDEVQEAKADGSIIVDHPAGLGEVKEAGTDMADVSLDKEDDERLSSASAERLGSDSQESKPSPAVMVEQDHERGDLGPVEDDLGAPGPLVFSDEPSAIDGGASSPEQKPEPVSIAPSTSSRSLQAPVHRASHASSMSSEEGLSSTPTQIYGVVLVGFHHALGPVVEFSHPPDLKEDPDVQKSIPFLALPDGAHLRDEDYSCFHLHLPRISRQTVYGISCIRQLRADELINRTSDITRSTVQKAVIVLANKPVFGPIRDKLGVITRTFFAQRDFSNTDLLVDFHASLQHTSQDDDQTSESALYMALSLREFVYKFRLQTLTLFKLLLLQRKVMFYGVQVERLCSFQYCLISLVPLLLMHLEDAASPLLESRAFVAKKPTSLKTSDRRSLLSYLGLPLNLFGIDSFFQPYLPLQQLEILQVAQSYLVGTTNSIFQSQRDCPIDVVVNVDSATIEFKDARLASLVTLTAADRKWMDDIVKAVEATWNPADPHRPSDMGFKASDDWLRSKFEEYICSTLSAIKFVDYLHQSKSHEVLVNSSDPTGLSSFNEAWLSDFRRTHAFEVWDRNTDPVIFDLVEPRHPCEGQAHLLEDVGIRLANGLHDLHLDERLAPTQEAISKGIATGSEGVWRVYSSLKADLAKRQAEYKEKKAKEEAELAALTPQERAAKEQEKSAGPDVANQVLAGAAEVGGKAASIASSFGSFLNSRLSKPRTQNLDVNTEGQPSRRSQEGTSPSPSASAEESKPRGSFFSGWRSTSSSTAPPPASSAAADAVQSTEAVAQATPPLSPPAERATSPAAAFGSFFRRASGALSPPADAGAGTSSGSSFFSSFARQQSSPPASARQDQAETKSLDGFQDVAPPRDLDQSGAEVEAARLKRLSIESSGSAGGTKMSEVKL